MPGFPLSGLFKKKALALGPAGPDLELIKQYSDPQQRRYPPVFVGRQAEIEFVEHICRAADDYYRAGKEPSGNIVVFSSAPGAGKTALLRHFKELWQGNSDCPQPLNLGLDDLVSAEETTQAIIEALAPRKKKPWFRRFGLGGSVSAGVPGVVKGTVSVSPQTEKAKTKYRNLKQMLPEQCWRRPLCLLVDEIHKITELHEPNLLNIHLADHGLPIVLIGAGLSHSADKLERVLSPRLNPENKRGLGTLAPEEVRSCLKQMFVKCRVDFNAEQLERYAGDIAARTEGWPQHVRTHTAALFRELDRTRGDLGAVSPAAVEKQAGIYREKSYFERRSGEIRRAGLLTGAVLKELPAQCHEVEALETINRKADPNKKGWQLPPGMTDADFLDHLIYRGVFQLDKNDRLYCPIPSLRSWLVAEADQLQAKLDGKPTAATVSLTEKTAKPASRAVNRKKSGRERSFER